MKSFRIKDSNLSLWQEKLSEFERTFTYPLGEDQFHIDHGSDYLKFFRRMGNPHFYGMEQHGQLIAAAAGVIHRRLKAWYLCDVKVHPDYRGRRIPLKFFRKYFLPCYLKCQRGFALNMESADGKPSPIVKIMQSLPWTPLKQGAKLLFYYEDAPATGKAMAILAGVRSDIRFSNLLGVKDLVLNSTGKAMPLLHMEWGDSSDETMGSPQAGYLHMWCLPADHGLVAKLQSAGISPRATGYIYHHRMDKTDWSELRTSEL